VVQYNTVYGGHHSRSPAPQHSRPSPSLSLSSADICGPWNDEGASTIAESINSPSFGRHHSHVPACEDADTCYTSMLSMPRDRSRWNWTVGHDPSWQQHRHHHNQHYLRNCLATATSEVAVTARRAGGRVRRLFGAGHSDASDQRCMLAWSDGERGGACGPLQAPPPLNGNGVGALVMDIIPADLLGSADGGWRASRVLVDGEGDVAGLLPGDGVRRRVKQCSSRESSSAMAPFSACVGSTSIISVASTPLSRDVSAVVGASIALLVVARVSSAMPHLGQRVADRTLGCDLCRRLTRYTVLSCWRTSSGAASEDPGARRKVGQRLVKGGPATDGDGGGGGREG